MKAFFKWVAIGVGLLVALMAFLLAPEGMRNTIGFMLAFAAGGYVLHTSIVSGVREALRREIALIEKLDFEIERVQGQNRVIIQMLRDAGFGRHQR